jgi:hypothetical protein
MSETPRLLIDHPPDDVTKWNIVPSQRDILRSDEVYLRPNFIGKSYPELKTYVDVQMRLLMEDFMQPLRNGMAKLLSGKFRDVQELRIYENVTIKRSGLIQDRRRVIPERESSWRIYSVNFKELTRVNWSSSRRLIHGSLVCLWDPTSNDLIVASVVHRFNICSKIYLITLNFNYLIMSAILSNPQELARGQVMLAIESLDEPDHFHKKVFKSFVVQYCSQFFYSFNAFCFIRRTSC